MKKIAIIEKDWKNKKKIHVSNKINLSSNISEGSSNIDEGIKAVLFFKRKDFTSTKSTKSIKKHKKHKTQTSDFHSDVFYADFLPLRCFLCE